MGIDGMNRTNRNKSNHTNGMAAIGVALLALASVMGPASAQTSDGQAFISDMTEFGWERQDPNSTFWSWGSYFGPDGPNAPNIGGFPTPLPTGFIAPDVFDSTPSSFITSTGNIYSFSDPVDITVEFPNYGLGDGFETEVVIQVLTIGNELDPESVALNAEGLAEDVPPDEIRELDRQFLGSGQFGGDRVETLLRWVVPGNASGYTAGFTAAAPSVSWSDFTIDTFAREADDPCARLDFNGDSAVDISDLIGFLNVFFSGSADGVLDFNGDQSIDIADLIEYIDAFFVTCN